MGVLSSLQSLALRYWGHHSPTMSDGVKREKKQHQTLHREFPVRCMCSGTGRGEINKLVSL